MSKPLDVTAWIDLNIVDQPWGKSLSKQFDEKKIKYLVETMPIPYTITWSISTYPGASSSSAAATASNINEEFVSNLLLFMTCEQWFEFVHVCLNDSGSNGGKELFDTINNNFSMKKSTTICVVGVSSFNNLCKMLNQKKPRLTIKQNDLENVLVQLQLLNQCVIKYVENDNDLALLVLSFTKAVSVAPQKRLKNQSPFTFHVDSMKKLKAIRIDPENSNQCLQLLWKQVLQQFPLVGIEQAQAISNQYPTIQSLVSAYDQCQTEVEAKRLLADIQVRRGAGVLTTTRKIGPQLSEKIWKFFKSENGMDLL
ncbi:unnamed protein product [Didymodactylos carnosus]|uniref:Crossover junction endonuclease EME1 n=1 Tax=Didymodactylos carnosus TaxID=1234261 RepID=A0A814A731_9BILA|nr:unnamed protein product [Didymodactylos carnosus]CAF0940157.1 unnamed protein product [Didymodactylos carnosus]CAF3691154.1 unnamed protein product [Didymodactylos carnosus]CAF3715406.1 unnamed protein product [Didymodactylos carnosus]